LFFKPWSIAMIPVDDTAKLDALAIHFPEPSQRKLDRIRREASEQTIRARIEFEALQELRNKRNDLRTEVARGEREKDQYGPRWDEPAEAALQRLKSDLGKIERQIEKREAAKSNKPERTREERRRSELLSDWAGALDVEDYFGRLSQLARFEHEAAKPKAATVAALKKVRDETDGVIDQILAARRSALDLPSIIAQMERDVDRHAKAGAPDIRSVGRLVRTTERSEPRQGNVEFPVGHSYDFALTRATTAQLGTAMLCWLFPNETKAKLRAGIVAKYGDNGMSIEARAARIAELESKLMELQRLETAIMDALEDAGTQGWERRPIHPLARLELRRIANAPRPERKPPQFEAPPDDFPTQGTAIPESYREGWNVPGHLRQAAEE
jgi:hypothetical protein